MIPLSDNNPTRILPLFTWALIAACVVAYGYQVTAPAGYEAGIMAHGFIPAHFFTSTGQAAPTLFTSMFMHGSLMHLGGNMLYLYVFGDNIENAMGRLRFLCFYLITGIAAALTQGLLNPGSTVPMVGASGAISGVLGAYLVLYPRQPITVLVPNAGIQHLPALVVLGLWFAYQFIYGLMASGQGGGVAFWAHVGGFVAGLVLVKLFTLGRTPYRPQLWSE